MAFDGLTVYTVAQELNNKLIEGRIDKVHQPEKDEILLSIRSKTGNVKLLLSCNASTPRMQLSKVKKNNPEHPPMFCMLLRKHIGGGRIQSIYQLNADRILVLDIASKNEMGDPCQKKLLIEIMGKHSNIILLNEENRILDSIKHITPEVSSVRMILPNQTYTLPPMTKLDPHNLQNAEDIYTELTSKNMEVFKGIYQTFNGLSPLVSQEILYRLKMDGSIHCSTLTKEQVEGIVNEIKTITLELKEGRAKHLIYKEGKKTIDFSCIPLSHLQENGDVASTSFEDMSTMLDEFYAAKDLYNRMHQKSYDLRKMLHNNLDRCYKKQSVLQKQLKDTKSRDKFKLYGELITANMYQIQQGDKVLNAINYYSEDSEEVKITLDPQKTPSENAQKYYKRYNKLKRTEEASIEQLEIVKDEITYFESLLTSVELCTSEEDLLAIRHELYEEGYAKRPKQRQNKKFKLQKPTTFKTSDGLIGYIGKNNKQNDNLTFKIAGPNDLWFHTKDIPGSHVILVTNNQEVPEDSIYEAAQIAAFYSKAKQSSTVPVDYTLRRHVKKPNGSKPGFVIYFHQKTLFATPDEAIVNGLLD